MAPVFAFDGLLEALWEIGASAVEFLAEVDWEVLLGIGAAAAGTALVAAGVYVVFDHLNRQKLLDKLPTLIEKDPEACALLKDKLGKADRKVSLSQLRSRVKNVSTAQDKGETVSVVEVELTRKDTGLSKTVKVAAKQLDADIHSGMVLTN